ncbi:ROK family protein [Streptomyces sp. NPDC056747]|uniref:ROK family protein n=1 Tax=Streptomyces sp. NPDC056747 TaxID=3345935 RepID=UPI00369B0F5A
MLGRPGCSVKWPTVGHPREWGRVCVVGEKWGTGSDLGEIGHIVVEPHGTRCACGSLGCLGCLGCLEGIASTTATTSAMNSRTGWTWKGSAEVAEQVLAGDRETHEATVLALLTTTLAPEVIVIGGGPREADDLLLAPPSHPPRETA